MSNTFTHDVVVSTGTYTDNQGQEKKRWMKIGAVFTDQETGNMSIKLDALPMPKESGTWLKLFRKDNQQQQAPQHPNQYPNHGQQPQRQQNFDNIANNTYTGQDQQPGNNIPFQV